MNKIADMLWEGVDKAVENYRSGTVNKSGETKYQLVGETPDGIEVYETSQGTLNKSLKERKKAYLDLMRNEYAGRTARFVRNGHTYYAEFDRENYSKPIYGEKHNSNKGYKALIRAGADGDVFDLVENSQYTHSSVDTKNHKAKDGFTDYFDYFVKTIQIDGQVYDLTATVKKQYGVNNGFTYSLFLKDNKKTKATPTKNVKTFPQSSGQPLNNITVPQGNGNVNTHSMQNSGENSPLSISEADYSGNGYDGYSMSNNARSAYENGEMPISKWSKSEIIRAISEIDNKYSEKLKKVPLSRLRAHFLEYTSWHHTSSKYNRTNFYTISENAVNELSDQLVDELSKKENNEKSEKPSWMSDDEWAYTQIQAENFSQMEKLRENLKDYEADVKITEFKGKHPYHKVFKDAKVTEKGNWYVITTNDGDTFKKKISGNYIQVTNKKYSAFQQQVLEQLKTLEDERKNNQLDYRRRNNEKYWTERLNEGKITDDAIQWLNSIDYDAGFSRSGNVYDNDHYPTPTAYENGLENFFEKGERRLRKEGENYKLEEWNGTDWSPNIRYSVSDSNGNQLSENQQKYFADSKVRDENGNLLVVRHGTNNEFNIFDFTKAGKNGAQEGYGFYFSDDPEITEKYGSIQKECYLNITKPLYNNQVTVNKTEIKKLADALIDFDIEKYADEDLTWQDSFLSNYVDTYSMSRAAAVREFVNQLFSTNDNDSDLVYEMAVADGRSYDPMLVKEFYDVLTDSIGYDGIIAEWKHKDGTSNVYVIFNSEQAKLTDNQNPTDNPDVRYSISKKFYNDFDKWDGKDTNTTFEIGNTSKALQSIGIKDQQFIMRSGMVRQKLNKHSELTRSTFRNIPELLEHPIIVQFSDAIDPKTGKAKYDSRITLLGELYAEMTVDGKKQKTPVLVSVELLPKSKGKTEISDFSVITSAYAKSNLQRYINENSILYIDPDKKRTNKWLSLNRLQLPLGENRLGSIRRITYIGGKVKIENSKNSSPMQAALEKAGVVNSSGISLLNNPENDTDFSEKILSDDQRASVSDAGMRLTDNTELSSLMRDNADYKAEIERLKGEFVKSKRMGGKGKNRLVQADINRIARDIISEYSSKIDFSTLRDELTGLYELMDNIEIQGSADYAEFVKLSNDIAKSVIASSYVDITDQSAEKYKAAMRSYRLTPSLQDVAELKDMFGTFGAAYRQYGRKLNMRAQGTPGALHIDEVWEDLCDSVPFLDRDAESTQDMWRNLIEVRDGLDEKNGFNPYITDGDLTANEAAGALGADILERFNEVRADTTFADRAQQRVDLRFPIVVMRIKIFSLTGCSDIINPSPNRTLSRNPLTARPTAHTLVPHDIKQCKQVYQQQCIMHKIVFVCKRCGLKAHSGRTESHLQGILERLGQNRQPLVSWQMILERRDRRLCPRL